MQDEPFDPVAERVYSAVGDLGVRFGREWSIKIDASAVSSHRFLLGLRKPRIAGDPDARLVQTCASLGMPPEALAQYRLELRTAQYVHFGFESSAGIPWVKAYLEFFDDLDLRVRSGEPRQPRYLVHRGFKWAPTVDGSAQVTSYWWHPRLSNAQLAARLAEMLAGDEGGRLRSVAFGLLDVAMQRTNPQNLHFLEVVEAGNERRSIDINFYRSRIRMADVRPAIEAAFAIHGHSSLPYAGWMERIAGDWFGHLAAGIDRYGRSFMTFYYDMTYLEPTS